MDIRHISIQGVGEWNEDAVIFRQDLQIYGVVDGATSLIPYRGANGETGGRLASQLIKKYFDQLGVGDGHDLETHAKKANAKLGEEMRECGIRTDRKSELWTAALAAIRIQEHHIEYVQAGDCMVIAMYRDGAVRTLTRDQVAYIGEESLAIWKQGIEQGIHTKEELWETVKSRLLQNKEKMNTPEGYSVINGLPDADNYLEYGKINRIGLAGLLLATDGLFYPQPWPVQEDETGSPEERLLRRVVAEGLEGYAKWLLDLEQDDPECIRYPRFKRSDDKTGIWIRF
ncbi:MULTISPECIES: protein phosphatase 2C domain-containing protein [Paenibacillus]|uniref:Serine/threonine protein phosphatase n=1 Tax=Paenibacillus albilobatus TaxID=2716884 RepID=A0A919XJR3_9BACL|nr:MULTISPECIES: protein phosphatase 2C domain-containing protein [Paenibacillus]GIO32663.1 serine/threonine protein phosphatase [Paenibacillus albilobatus]